jgi:hypothetical protein
MSLAEYSAGVIWFFERDQQNCFFLKSSRATSRIKWFEWQKNQRFQDHLRPRPRSEMVLETLVFSPFNHLTAREDFIIHSRLESSRSYKTVSSFMLKFVIVIQCVFLEV